MPAVIFLLLLLVPLAELWVIVESAQRIGVPSTLILLLLVSVAGAWLLKQQGVATWRRLQQALTRGEVPTKELTDGALILFGGALLLTPGFLTDAAGLVLLLPPTRASIKGVARRMLGRWARKRMGARRGAHAATVIRTERRERPTTVPLPPSRPARGGSRSEEGGSPDIP